MDAHSKVILIVLCLTAYSTEKGAAKCMLHYMLPHSNKAWSVGCSDIHSSVMLSLRNCPVGVKGISANTSGANPHI